MTSKDRGSEFATGSSDALHNLRLAYKYKGRVLAGQEFPDPRFDSSFKKYLNNKIFMAELQKMK